MADDRAGVLIVEDEFFIAIELEAALEAAGIAVSGIATTADEALSLAKAYGPRVAIMDIRLQGPRDGIEAAVELRAIGIRSIFTSAYADAATRARGEQADPFGWMPKPYDLPALLALVRNALAETRSSPAPAIGAERSDGHPA
jgi:DNA-binding NarL/FixJ family response regulator